jgi:membrane-bound metal-dependent hydrolase YbcI (DUF457 family)
MMVAGHFGLAAGVKSQAPGAPLWALMLASQWLDVFFVPLFLMGIESTDAVNPANPNAYGGSVIHAVYTHSLVGALVLSALAGVLAWTLWGRRIGGIIAAVAFSHWLLDLVVHRPDLPILPGNAGGLPLLGFGLWAVPVVAAVIELVLVLGGAYLYYRRATRLPSTTPASSRDHRRRVLTASAVVTGLMLLTLVLNVLGF